MTLQDPAVLPTQYQQFIHLSRYARWDYENERRETWAQTVNRYFNFFQEHLQEQKQVLVKVLVNKNFYKNCFCSCKNL